MSRGWLRVNQAVSPNSLPNRRALPPPSNRMQESKAGRDVTATPPGGGKISTWDPSKRKFNEGSHAVAPLALRPTWRQLDWDMLRGGRHNWASISGSVALERFQNEKKLLSKHGRNLAVTVSPFVEMDHWEFNHLYEIAALDFADQD
jgi:hypothetical protein